MSGGQPRTNAHQCHALSPLMVDKELFLIASMSSRFTFSFNRMSTSIHFCFASRQDAMTAEGVESLVIPASNVACWRHLSRSSIAAGATVRVSSMAELVSSSRKPVNVEKCLLCRGFHWPCRQRRRPPQFPWEMARRFFGCSKVVESERDHMA